MAIENKYKEGRFNKNKQFFKKYHANILPTNCRVNG